MVNLRDRIRAKEVTIGSWITIGHPAVGEIMCKAKFDWLTIDMEHSVIGLREVQDLVSIIGANGITPLVRVGENNPNLIKRVLDTGAQGIIVANVNSRVDAERAVAAAKYPPVGSRGVGIARAHGYGQYVQSYIETANSQTVVVIQIEHINALNEIGAIFSVEGVDAFIIGPYDLSGSMGIPGQLNHIDLLSVQEVILNSSREHEIAAGIHLVEPSIAQAEQLIKTGFQFLGFGLDVLWLGNSCIDSVRSVRERMTKL